MCPNSCKSCRTGTIRNKSKVTLIVLGLLLLSLLLGNYFTSGDNFSEITQKLPEYRINPLNENIFEYYVNDSLMGFGAIGQSKGYGGPLTVAVLASRDTSIRQVVPLLNTETPSFYQKFINQEFFKFYSGESLYVEPVVNAVSGATVTSNAYQLAVSKAMNQLLEEQFHKETWLIKPKMNFNKNEWIVLVFMLCSFWLFRLIKNRKTKLLWYLVVVVLMGFILKIQLSSTHLSGLAINKMPGLYNNLNIWILVIGVILGILILGRNYYCFRICPFHALQYLLSQISDINIKTGKKLNTVLKYGLATVVFLYYTITFITHDPTKALYEPFSTLFSLQGTGLQWLFLILILIAAFLIKNVFCRFMCPVGYSLSYIQSLRLIILNNIKKSKKNDHEKNKII